MLIVTFSPTAGKGGALSIETDATANKDHNSQHATTATNTNANATGADQGTANPSAQSSSIHSTHPIVKLSPFGTAHKMFFPTSVQPAGSHTGAAVGNVNSVSFSDAVNEANTSGGANNNNSPMFDSPLGPSVNTSGIAVNLMNPNSANISTSNLSGNMGSNMGSVPNISGAGGSAPARPVLSRSVSHNASMESYRQTIAEIISQIRYVHECTCVLSIFVGCVAGCGVYP